MPGLGGVGETGSAINLSADYNLDNDLEKAMGDLDTLKRDLANVDTGININTVDIVGKSLDSAMENLDAIKNALINVDTGIGKANEDSFIHGGDGFTRRADEKRWEPNVDKKPVNKNEASNKDATRTAKNDGNIGDSASPTHVHDDNVGIGSIFDMYPKYHPPNPQDSHAQADAEKLMQMKLDADKQNTRGAKLY